MMYQGKQLTNKSLNHLTNVGQHLTPLSTVLDLPGIPVTDSPSTVLKKEALCFKSCKTLIYVYENVTSGPSQ